MQKIFAVMLATFFALLGSVPVDAKGCIKGAFVGGAVGHYAGHHTALGALAAEADQPADGRICWPRDDQ
jgi:hypothetical protein